MSLFPDLPPQLHAGGREVLDRYYTPADLLDAIPADQRRELDARR